MDADIVDILLEIKSELSRTTTLVEGLAGPEGRIKKLEVDNTRQWWLAVAIAPALALAHGVARKLGVQI